MEIWTSETAQVRWSQPRHAQTNLLVHTRLTCPSFGPPGASWWSAVVSSQPAWGLGSRSPTACTATACVRTPGKVLANACKCQEHGHARREMKTMKRQLLTRIPCPLPRWNLLLLSPLSVDVSDRTRHAGALGRMDTGTLSLVLPRVEARLCPVGLVCNHQFARPNHRVLSYAPVMCESCWQGCHCHQVGKGMGMGVYQHFSEGYTHKLPFTLAFCLRGVRSDRGFSGWWEPGFTAAQLYFRSTELPSIFGLTSSTGSGSTPMGGKTEEKAQRVHREWYGHGMSWAPPRT